MADRKKYPEPFRREGSKVYYYRTYDAEGRRTWRSTGETTKERARAAIRAAIDAAEAESRRPASGAVPFKEYASRYFIWEEGQPPACPHASRLKSEGRVIGRTHVLDCHRMVERALERNPQFAALRLDEIRRSHILDLRAKIAAQFSPRQAQRIYGAIKIIFSEAAFREDISASPAAAVGPQKIENRERGAFTREELRALLEAQPGRMATEPRVAAFVTFLATTGARAGEARGLRWGSVNLETRELAIIEAAKHDLPETGGPKWEKPRRIIIPRLAADALTAWRKVAARTAPDAFVFGDEDGAMLSQGVLQRIWATVMADLTAEREGGPLVLTSGRWLTPHSLRHSLNSLLLAAGASPIAVAEYMGWSSDLGAALTRIQANYSHVNLIDLRRVADTIDAELGPKADPGNVRQFA